MFQRVIPCSRNSELYGLRRNQSFKFQLATIRELMAINAFELSRWRGGHYRVLEGSTIGDSRRAYEGITSVRVPCAFRVCRATLIMSPCGDIRNVPFYRCYDIRNVP